MSLFLINKDLEENPTARVPICLCLDVSGSMGESVGLGGITALQELKNGVNLFYENLLSDEVARYSAEICIVTFGGNEAKIIMDFASLDYQENERQQKISGLSASGKTPMGEAVNMALDCLEKRKKEYQKVGVDYFQPWLVLMTDGKPNGSKDELERAGLRTTKLSDQSKLTIFPIGIGNKADMNCLERFSPKRSPLRLKGLNFKEFFEWLSKSVEKTSQSMPGDKIKLDISGIKSWAEL